MTQGCPYCQAVMGHARWCPLRAASSTMRRMRENLTGRVFDQITVLDDNLPPVGRNRQRRARCQCSCGKIYDVQVSWLRANPGQPKRCVGCANSTPAARATRRENAARRPRDAKGVFVRPSGG